MQWSVLFITYWMGTMLLFCQPAGAITRPELPAIHTRHATKTRHVQHPVFTESVAFEELRTRPHNQVDLVEYQLRSAKSKAMVAVTAGIFMALFVHFLSMMLFSGSSPVLFWVAALGSGGAVYMKGDYGDVCRAIGVAVLILTQRTAFMRFLVHSVSQGKAMLQLARRRPFPPCINPWQYFPLEGEEDLGFSMFSTLASMVFLGAYGGWLLVRPVPLLPNWLGAVVGAGLTGYTTTVRDGRGDMLRLLGHSIARAVGVVGECASDVQLSGKVSALLGHVLFLSQTVDSKYQIVAKLQFLLADLITRLTMLISRIRRDAQGDVEPPGRFQRGRDPGSAGRYAAADPPSFSSAAAGGRERGARGAYDAPYDSDYSGYTRGGDVGQGWAERERDDERGGGRPEKAQAR